jgi:hypothetical protein
MGKKILYGIIKEKHEGKPWTSVLAQCLVISQRREKSPGSLNKKLIVRSI